MTTFSRIIERYGDGAALYTHGGEMRESKCFVQPIISRTGEKSYGEMTALGMKDKSGYYGYFPENADVTGCEYVICDGAAYDIVKAERFKVNGRAVHWEAVMKKREAQYGE